MTTTLAKANSTTIELLDSRWDRARLLLNDGKRTAEEFAAEIERLRESFYNEGRGGDRRSKNQTPHVAAFDPAPGFQAAVRRELGISDDTARRILDRVRYTRMLASAAAGEEVKYLTGTGAKKHEASFLPSEEAMTKARDLLADVVAGDVKPSAAWAGVVGETRRVAATGKKERAATDHAENLRRALRAFGTSLEHWRSLSTAERADIEQGWAQIVAAGLIPSTWAR